MIWGGEWNSRTFASREKNAAMLELNIWGRESDRVLIINDVLKKVPSSKVRCVCGGGYKRMDINVVFTIHIFCLFLIHITHIGWRIPVKTHSDI